MVCRGYYHSHARKPKERLQQAVVSLVVARVALTVKNAQMEKVAESLVAGERGAQCSSLS